MNCHPNEDTQTQSTAHINKHTRTHIRVFACTPATTSYTHRPATAFERYIPYVNRNLAYQAIGRYFEKTHSALHGAIAHIRCK